MDWPPAACWKASPSRFRFPPPFLFFFVSYLCRLQLIAILWGGWNWIYCLVIDKLEWQPIPLYHSDEMLGVQMCFGVAKASNPLKVCLFFLFSFLALFVSTWIIFLPESTCFFWKDWHLFNELFLVLQCDLPFRGLVLTFRFLFFQVFCMVLTIKFGNDCWDFKRLISLSRNWQNFYQICVNLFQPMYWITVFYQCHVPNLSSQVSRLHQISFHIFLAK